MPHPTARTRPTVGTVIGELMLTAGVLLLLMLPIPSGSAIDNPLAGAEPLLLAIASPLLALLLLRLPGSTGEQQPTAT